MARLLISRPARPGLLYAAMSLLLVWHSLAMIVGPAPDSDLTDAARGVVGPYLNVFRLEHSWSFFAPDVRLYPDFRYVVQDASGQEHTFTPTVGLNRFRPSDIWIEDWYTNVGDEPDTYAEATAMRLCREQAALHPVQISLIGVERVDFTPDDELAGKHLYDPEFDDEMFLGTFACPAS